MEFMHMKRYRTTRFDFDFRVHHLNAKIKETWQPEVKELHRKNQKNIKKGLIYKYGEYEKDSKLKNFIDLGESPLSIIAFHNKFFYQIRSSFIISAYYPALTGTCALGERILNHLILRLKDYHKSSSSYKKIYNKKSFNDWGLAIEILDEWKVFLSDVIQNYKKLAKIRNRSIHFNPETDHCDRELSLEAILLMVAIIKAQFSAFGSQPWFIQNTRGVCFIKKEYEINPFIKEIYLPSCDLVGPFHLIENIDNKFVIKDDHDYEQKEITDEEFVDLYNNNKGK